MKELRTVYNDITSAVVEIGSMGYSAMKKVDITGTKAILRIEYIAKETAPNEYQWTINFKVNNKDDWKHFWSADVYSGYRDSYRIPFELFVYELKFPMYQCLMSRMYTAFRFDGRVDKWTKKELQLWKEVFNITDEEWQMFINNLSK